MFLPVEENSIRMDTMSTILMLCRYHHNIINLLTMLVHVLILLCTLRLSKDHPMQKAIAYSVENDGVEKPHMTPEEKEKYREEVYRAMFLEGSIKLTGREAIMHSLPYAMKYKLTIQISDTLLIDHIGMIMRKGIPWAREYKDIML